MIQHWFSWNSVEVKEWKSDCIEHKMMNSITHPWVGVYRSPWMTSGNWLYLPAARLRTMTPYRHRVCKRCQRCRTAATNAVTVYKLVTHWGINNIFNLFCLCVIVVLFHWYLVTKTHLNIGRSDLNSDLEPKRRQAFIWTSDRIIYLRMYASLGL